VVLRGRAGGSHCPPAPAVVSVRPDLLAGENLPPAPRQKRSEDKRARLKEAGLALFGKKGYQGTSIEEVASRANLAVGGFYQHFHSKRQLLLTLMDDLLEGLSQLDLRPAAAGDIRAGLRDLLSRAFSRDLRYLGAYRAWQEAALSDPDLARRQRDIHAWTTARITAVFTLLHGLPGARAGVDIPGLARAMDSFFWTLLAQAVRLSTMELNQWTDSATHLIYHALFTDPPRKRRN
jgi:AcrR family transcriptional regulator